MRTVLGPSAKKQIRDLMREVGVDFAPAPTKKADDIAGYPPGRLVKTSNTNYNMGKTPEYAFTCALMEALNGN